MNIPISFSLNKSNTSHLGQCIVFTLNLFTATIVFALPLQMALDFYSKLGDILGANGKLFGLDGQKIPFSERKVKE